MSKLLLIPAALIAAIVLAACEPTPEEKAYVNAVLPDGCTLHELGSYGDIKSLVVITCEGKDTTTTNGAWTQSHGKTSSTYQYASVVIE